MCISVWDCEQVRVCAQGVQIKVSDCLELELQASVSHILGVLETQLGSPERAAWGLSHRAISSDPNDFTFIF